MTQEILFPGSGMHADVPDHHPTPLKNPRLVMVTLKRYLNWVMYYDDPEKTNARLPDGRLSYGTHVFVGYKNGQRIVVQKPITVMPKSGRVMLFSDEDVVKALEPFFDQVELYKKLRETAAVTWHMEPGPISPFAGMLVQSITEDERQTRSLEAVKHLIPVEQVQQTEFYYVAPFERADEIERMIEENLFPAQSEMVH